MDLVQLRQEIFRVSRRLDNVTKGIVDAAKEQAEAESEYDIALMREILQLKEEGYPATLIEKVAKGKVAEQGLRTKLNLAEGKYKASVKGADSLMSEMSGLQSILRTQEDIG